MNQALQRGNRPYVSSQSGAEWISGAILASAIAERGVGRVATDQTRAFVAEDAPRWQAPGPNSRCDDLKDGTLIVGDALRRTAPHTAFGSSARRRYPNSTGVQQRLHHPAGTLGRAAPSFVLVTGCDRGHAILGRHVGGGVGQSMFRRSLLQRLGQQRLTLKIVVQTGYVHGRPFPTGLPPSWHDRLADGVFRAGCQGTTSLK